MQTHVCVCVCVIAEEILTIIVNSVLLLLIGFGEEEKMGEEKEETEKKGTQERSLEDAITPRQVTFSQSAF